MALYRVMRYHPKSSDFSLIRVSNTAKHVYKLFSSLKSVHLQKSDMPLNFSKTAASKISVAENLRLGNKEEKVWFKPYLVAGSVIAFMIYFCYLREENDIDEMLKGNKFYESDETKYLNLKLRLKYAEINHLPTKTLKATIEEYERKLGKSV